MSEWLIRNRIDERIADQTRRLEQRERKEAAAAGLESAEATASGGEREKDEAEGPVETNVVQPSQGVASFVRPRLTRRSFVAGDTRFSFYFSDDRPRPVPIQPPPGSAPGLGEFVGTFELRREARAKAFVKSGRLVHAGNEYESSEEDDEDTDVAAVDSETVPWEHRQMDAPVPHSSSRAMTRTSSMDSFVRPRAKSEGSSVVVSPVVVEEEEEKVAKPSTALTLWLSGRGPKPDEVKALKEQP